MVLRIPLPGAPSSSWESMNERIKQVFAGADPRVCVAFWLFGLINNVLYVIILSAALDLVGPNLPKGMVLLFDVVPSFFTKLVAPYFIHLIPYRMRIIGFFLLSTLGMQFVAFADSIPWRMFGVVLASIASGAGELSFLGLTHYYGNFALAFWSSGTGGAGIIGAALYLAATTWLGLGIRKSLVGMSLLPFIMLFAFFLVLPRAALAESSYTAVAGDVVGGGHIGADGPERHADDDEDGEDEGGQNLLTRDEEDPTNTMRASSPVYTTRKSGSTGLSGALDSFAANLKRAKHLFWPYMLPLLLVYIGEYTINQGVAPTLLYPLEKMPFRNYRDVYPTYATIYQVGVFISRSSTPFIRVKHLYPPSLLQFVNLFLLVAHAIWYFIPSIWIIFAVIFWEGILGGLVYVNTFAEIADNVPHGDREFSLSATTVSDSGGICIAGIISMGLETWLCGWQVAHGRDYCKKT